MAKRRQSYIPPIPKSYSEAEIEQMKENILVMDQYSMASMWRFHPLGHPYFDTTLPLWPVFEARFKELGGMTPEISKSLGWER